MSLFTPLPAALLAVRSASLARINHTFIQWASEQGFEIRFTVELVSLTPLVLRCTHAMVPGPPGKETFVCPFRVQLMQSTGLWYAAEESSCLEHNHELNRAKAGKLPEKDADRMELLMAGQTLTGTVQRTTSDGDIRNAVWAVRPAAKWFSAFPVVLTIDVALKTNRSGRALLIFNSVDNHGTAFLVGAAVTEDESEKSLVWALEEFRRIVGPSTENTECVIANNHAVSGAVAERVFPRAVRLLCFTQIQKRVIGRARGLSAADRGRLQDAVEDMRASETLDDFERTYAQTVADPAFEPVRPLLQELYGEKDRWATACLHGHMTCGIRATAMGLEANRTLRKLMHMDAQLSAMAEESSLGFHKIYVGGRESRDRKLIGRRPTCPVSEHQHAARCVFGCADHFGYDFVAEEIGAAFCLAETPPIPGGGDGHWKVTVGAESFAVFVMDGRPATCTCGRFGRWRLPCRHTLFVLRTQRKALQTSHFDPMWLLHLRDVCPSRELRSTQENLYAAAEPEPKRRKL